MHLAAAKSHTSFTNFGPPSPTLVRACRVLLSGNLVVGLQKDSPLLPLFNVAIQVRGGLAECDDDK